MSHIEYPKITAGDSSANLDKVLEFYFGTPLAPGRLYRNLRHLTRDEKKLQRKLMNRTNAQSSCNRIDCGRKKAEVEELEETLRIIKAEATKLRLENERLKARIHQLEKKTVKDQDRCCFRNGQSTSTIQIKQKLLPHLSTESPNLLERAEPSRIAIQNAEHNKQKQLRTISAIEPYNNRWVKDQNRYSIIDTPVYTNHVCKTTRSEKTSENVLQQKYRYSSGEEDQYPVIGSVFQI